MRFPKKTAIFLLLVGGATAAGFAYLPDYVKELRKTRYREAEVTRGTVTATVNSTGTVQPVLSVSVGSFVSGPIKEVNVDFNDVVKKGELMAKIDPRIYEASVLRDQAVLATAVALKASALAQVESAVALHKQAVNDEQRALDLFKQNEDFVSKAEMDKVRFGKESLKAQLDVAKAAVQQAEASYMQAEANLKKSKADLEYTDIVSPVDGIIINRKIDPGQTLAAQFQTPEMFIVAPDLATMHIIASVDETDIGLIHKAQLRGFPVHFTVDSYRGDLFEGKIIQIRMNSTTTQNVVTYPVVVEAKNPELPAAENSRVDPKKGPSLKLKPGMTASLTFQVDEVKDVLRIPNAALRYYPQRDKVRPEDRKLLEGVVSPSTKADDESAQTKQTAQEKAKGRQDQNRRHVWVQDGDYLRAIEVIIGLSDQKFTQVISGEVTEGMQLVTGIQMGE